MSVEEQILNDLRTLRKETRKLREASCKNMTELYEKAVGLLRSVTFDETAEVSENQKKIIKELKIIGMNQFDTNNGVLCVFCSTMMLSDELKHHMEETHGRCFHCAGHIPLGTSCYHTSLEIDSSIMATDEKSAFQQFDEFNNCQPVNNCDLAAIIERNPQPQHHAVVTTASIQHQFQQDQTQLTTVDRNAIQQQQQGHANQGNPHPPTKWNDYNNFGGHDSPF